MSITKEAKGTEVWYNKEYSYIIIQIEFSFKKSGGCRIYEIPCRKDTVSSERYGKISLEQKSPSHIENVSMFLLCSTILLWSI